MQPAAIRIMPLKFLDSTGSGSTSDAVKAIYYAVNNGAKVLNNSWGGGGFSNSLLNAIAYAYDKKVVFVAAASPLLGKALFALLDEWRVVEVPGV